MNICMCGAQAGYPHDNTCPYPYYGRDVKQESAWLDACEKKAAQLHQQPGAVVPLVEVVDAKDIDPEILDDLESQLLSDADDDDMQLLSAELSAQGNTRIVVHQGRDITKIVDDETLQMLDDEWNKYNTARTG